MIYIANSLKHMKEIKDVKAKFIEDNYFRPRWYSVFFNPYFIGRSSLYGSAKKFSGTLGGQKRILDVGCGLKPYAGLFIDHGYVGIDVEDGYRTDETKKVDGYFDGLNIPFDNGSFDVILCTEVLEHAIDPEKLVSECSRVLAPGGVLYVTAPLTWNEHEAPYDFRRFTRYGLKKTLEDNGFDVESVTPTSGLFGTIGQLISAAIFESVKFRSTTIKLVLSFAVLAPIQIVSIIMDKIFKNEWIALGYIAVAINKYPSYEK